MKASEGLLASIANISKVLGHKHPIAMSRAFSSNILPMKNESF